jgi:hypothetical protein
MDMNESAELTRAEPREPGREPRGAGRGKLSTVLIIIIGALLVFALFEAFSAGGAGGALEIAREAGNARAARVELRLGVTDLRLDAAGSAGLLLEGQAERGRWEQVSESFAVRNGVADYQLRSRRVGPSWFWTGGTAPWNLHLNPALPTELEIDAGVGRLDLDLRDATLTALRLDLGVGSTTVVLPASGPLPVNISAGVGDTSLRVPAGAPVRLTVNTGLGDVTVSGELQRSGDTWTSASYAANARNALEIRVDGGVGAIAVSTY